MWKKDSFRLFLSHDSDHREFANNLKFAFSYQNIDLFVAHDDIEPTRQWEDEIEDALRTMDALAALLTPGFYKSKWADQEVGFAFGSGRLVLPLMHGAPPHGFIGKYQGFPIRAGQKSTEIAADVAKLLIRHNLSSRQMASAIAHKLRNAISWDSAKSAIGLLEEAPVIDDEDLDLIESAVAGNSQVSDAWGVPGRITSLIKKHRQIGQS